jgi:hypothetical protein
MVTVYITHTHTHKTWQRVSFTQQPFNWCIHANHDAMSMLTSTINTLIINNLEVSNTPMSLNTTLVSDENTAGGQFALTSREHCWQSKTELENQQFS